MLENLARKIPGALFRYCVELDGRSRLDFMSPGCRDIWELDPQAVALDMGALWAMVHEDDRLAMRASVDASAAALTDWSHQWRIATPSGRTKWLHGVGRPERSPEGALVWHVFVLDVTSSRHAQALRLEAEQRFRRLLDQVPNVAVQGYGTDLKVHYWNRASETLYGYSPDEAMGRGLLDLIIPDEMKPAVQEAVHAMFTRGDPIPPGELDLRHKDGGAVSVYSSHVLLAREGQDPEMFCVDVDLSERRRAEASRAQLEAQLRESQKMEALGTLAGGIAHDFNNIVAAIMGNIELALEDVPPDHPAHTSLQEVRKAGRRARNVVQQILAFTRRRAAHKEPLDLGRVLRETEGLLRAGLPAGVALEIDIDPDTPAVLGDLTQLEQVLLNLCTNAWQACRDAPAPRIRVALDAVPAPGPDEGVLWPGGAPSARWPLRNARLTVEDNGCGMDAATQARVFEPFFTTKPPGTGTGLGLAVVHGVLREHGAGIRLVSAPGEGARFVMLFPAAPDAAALPATAPPSSGPPVANVPDRPVVYVDDDTAIGDLVRRAFERSGRAVTVAHGADECLAHLRRSPGVFALVVTDQNMPGVSGVELAAQIRAEWPDVPVVITSGYVSDDLCRRAAAAGARDVLHKPDTVDQVVSRLQALVAQYVPRDATRGGV